MNYRIAGFMLAAGMVLAQTRPSFEVVSIKPSNSGDRRTMFSLQPDGRFTAVNVTVKSLIQSAYGNIKDFQISGGPGWVSSDLFDINATSDGPIDRDKLALVLQSLLAERFQLDVRREIRELPVYTLVVDKNGPKFKEADESFPSIIDLAGRGSPRGGHARPPAMRLRAGSLTAQEVDMSAFAFQLSNFLGRSVVDQTRLTAKYDLKLEWTPDENQAANLREMGVAEREIPAVDPGPSLFTALQEQLGLKLESAKGPVEVFMIERIERPSEN